MQLVKPDWLQGLDISGYVDTSYNYLLRKNTFTSSIQNRSNDVEQNGFTLQQVAFTIKKLPTEGLGGLLNIISGRDPNNLIAYGMNPYLGSQTLTFDPEQAYLQYGKSSLTFLGGKFNTLAGVEDANPTLNTNFSGSQCETFAEPSTHIGLRGIYTHNDQLNFTMGVNNGWDTFHRTGQLNTLELGATYQPNSIYSFSIQGYSGKQYLQDQFSSGPSGFRNFVNFFGTINVTKQLSFVLNGDYGVQTKGLLAQNVIGRAIWSGLVGYVNYQWTEKWLTSVRGEYFNDPDGFRTGVRQSMKEGTITLAYKPRKNITFRAETRHDFSNNASFVNKSGGGTNNNQQSYALEGIYEF